MDIPSQEAMLKVIGIGNTGGEVINQMIAQGVQGINEYIAINTDAQALEHNQANIRLAIDATEQLSETAQHTISNAIKSAHMVFVVAGLGDNTGSYIAPVIAQIARQFDAATIAVVSIPLAMKGDCMHRAIQRLNALNEHADSSIVVPHAQLMAASGGGISAQEISSRANNIMQSAIAAIAAIITVPGLVRVDFADVRTVMSERGIAISGFGTATGQNRALLAVERAVTSALLKNVDLQHARGMMVHITSDKNIRLKEISDVMEFLQPLAEQATMIFGTSFDQSMGDEIRVAVIATGLSRMPGLIYRTS